MTTTLDDLPLPVPTHFRNGVLYAFSADQIRAARREGYELAMRKVLEGREPVVLPDGFFDALSDLLGDSNMAERVHRLITSWCDTSPPHKSDEARDALISIGGQLASVAFNLAQRAGHALTGDDVAMLDKLRKQWDAALAAQQSNGEAA